MKSNIIKTFVALVITGIIVIPAYVGAQVPSTDGGNTGGASSDSSAPSTDGGNTGGASSGSSAPSTDGGNTGGADSNGNESSGSFVPSTDGGNTGGADSNSNESSGDFVPETDGGNTGGADTGENLTDDNDDNSNGGGGSRRSGGSRRTTVVSAPVVTLLPTTTNIGNCSYLTSYMKIGGKNNYAEVVKLQNFLKNTEGLNVDITGIFDQKTLDAVKAFQLKYVDDVMRPWGVKTPTGQVWYTTQKKINEVFCKTNFTLTPSQLAQIEAYKANRANGTSTVSNGFENSTTTIPLSEDVGTATDSDQVASAEGSSFFGKIWNFIKWLFGY